MYCSVKDRFNDFMFEFVEFYLFFVEELFEINRKESLF